MFESCCLYFSCYMRGRYLLRIWYKTNGDYQTHMQDTCAWKVKCMKPHSRLSNNAFPSAIFPLSDKQEVISGACSCWIPADLTAIQHAPQLTLRNAPPTAA